MSNLVNKIVDISILAGHKIMEVYEGTEDWGIEAKSDDSPLTKADKAANDLIVEHLEKLETQYPIISEENKLQAYDERKDFERFWLVDPLDGTKEFIKRNGEFTVNIALIENGAPILGVVYVPVTKDVYYGVKGEGSFHKDEHGTALKFILLASGQAEVYPRMGPTMEWDTGAAQIVLEEAGGQILHHETMTPLTYNKEDLLNPFFIATAAHHS